MKRNILILMVMMLMTALTMPGFAQSIDVVESGPNFRQFEKAVSKCDFNGICKTERDAKMAELKRRALIRACNSEFGASAAGPCINKLLGDWKNVEFRVKTVEEPTPPPPPEEPAPPPWTPPEEPEVDVEEDPTEVADAGKKKKKRRKKRRPQPPPTPPTPTHASEPFKGEIINAGAVCKVDLCRCRGSHIVVLKGEVCPGEDPWFWAWLKDPGSCPQGYAEVKIDHPSGMSGCYAEGVPEEELGKPDSRYLCSVWQPEPRSWSQMYPIAAAWLAVGLPLLLIIAALAFLAWYFFLRKKDELPPPPGKSERSEEDLDTLVHEKVDSVVSRRLKAFGTCVGRELNNADEKVARAFDLGVESFKRTL